MTQHPLDEFACVIIELALEDIPDFPKIMGKCIRAALAAKRSFARGELTAAQLAAARAKALESVPGEDVIPRDTRELLELALAESLDEARIKTLRMKAQTLFGQRVYEGLGGGRYGVDEASGAARAMGRRQSDAWRALRRAR